jgi:hypothetical protein
MRAGSTLALPSHAVKQHSTPAAKSAIALQLDDAPQIDVEVPGDVKVEIKEEVK